MRELGALCQENAGEADPTGSGPLDGLTFAVKDVFDVAGQRTGFGQPTWLATHLPAEATAPAVGRLLAAGACMIGRAICDELTYSLDGENVHYGTPLNPACPERIPGGSSSGSASAVAGGLCEFSLGTDCAGSVRIPASFCGLYGMRPTRGRVPLKGAAPFARSFDTAGWLTRDADVLELVGHTLIDERSMDAPGNSRLLGERPARPHGLIAQDALWRRRSARHRRAAACGGAGIGPARRHRGSADRGGGSGALGRVLSRHPGVRDLAEPRRLGDRAQARTGPWDPRAHRVGGHRHRGGRIGGAQISRERRRATRRAARPGRRGDPPHCPGPGATPRPWSRRPRRPAPPGDLAALRRRPRRTAPGDASACDARGLPLGPIADRTSWLRPAAAARPVPGLIP